MTREQIRHRVYDQVFNRVSARVDECSLMRARSINQTGIPSDAHDKVWKYVHIAVCDQAWHQGWKHVWGHMWAVAQNEIITQS